MDLVGPTWGWSWKIHCSSHISPSLVVHHTGSLVAQQHQMRFPSVKKASQRGLWNRCCFVLVVWSCLLEPSMKRFWQDKKLKVIFSKVGEPDPTQAAYTDPWTFFFLLQRYDFSKISLVAALRSTNSSCKWYFILGSHFLVNLFNSMPVLSRASFLNISCNSSDIYLCNRLFVTCVLEYYWMCQLSICADFRGCYTSLLNKC